MLLGCIKDSAKITAPSLISLRATSHRFPLCPSPHIYPIPNTVIGVFPSHKVYRWHMHFSEHCFCQRFFSHTSNSTKERGAISNIYRIVQKERNVSWTHKQRLILDLSLLIWSCPSLCSSGNDIPCLWHGVYWKILYHSSYRLICILPESRRRPLRLSLLDSWYQKRLCEQDKTSQQQRFDSLV